MGNVADGAAPRPRRGGGSLLAAACAAGWMAGGGASGAELELRIEAAAAAGPLVCEVFDSVDGFEDFRAPVRRAVFSSGEAEVHRIGDLAPGSYAVLVYVDENGNGRLDRNFIGIPREPIGFSNDYRPKGPPSYARARFVLAEGERRGMAVRTERPLGRRGQIGVGVGLIAQSSPYRGSDEQVWQAIPAVTYLGERLQILGPRVQLGLAGSGDLRLAAALRYRIGAYEEDDSPALAGLGDREDTLMAGPVLRWELPAGIDLRLSYEHDVLDRIGGGDAVAAVDRSLPWGPVRLSPGVALRWTQADLANHEFGVPADGAAPGRPAYAPGSVLSAEVQLGAFVELSRRVRVVLDGAVEFLDRDIRDSPIVDRDYLLHGFAAVNYTF